MKDIYKFLITSFIICVMFTINTTGTIYYYKNYVIEFKETCNSCQLYNPEVKYGLGGVYHHDKYYCVWTEGREIKEIINSEKHEVCHHLVKTDSQHFCKLYIDDLYNEKYNITGGK